MAEVNTIKECIKKIVLDTEGGIRQAADQISDYLDTLDEVPDDISGFIKGIVQHEAIQALIDNNWRGLIAMATGTGKSKVAIDVINWHYENFPHVDELTNKSLISVPTEKLRDENWLDEFKKWGKSSMYDNCIERTCYASLNKIIERHFPIVVLDEGHNITENNAEFFSNNTMDKLILLTATVPNDPVKVRLLEELNIPIVYEISLDIAVKLRLVSPYEIVIVDCYMDDVHKIIQGGTKAKPFMQTEKAAYNWINNQVNRLMFMRNRSASDDSKLQNYILKRMRLIYNLKSKEKAAKFILDNIIPQDERTIIFCGSIDQSKELCENTYHSKTTDADLTAFKNCEINRIACVNALNEGHNIEWLDNGLVAQLNSKEKALIQRLGRLVRYRLGHRAKIWILRTVGTVDAKWVASATENLDKSKITVTTINALIEQHNKSKVESAN